MSKIQDITKKANKNSVIMKYAISLMKQITADIRAGVCSEEELTDALSKFHPEVKGYIREDMFMNYDEACKTLGIGWNRNKLNDLCKLHGIKNHKFNNAPIGFKADEIKRLIPIVKKKAKNNLDNSK
jgi:hypothetical protein